MVLNLAYERLGGGRQSLKRDLGTDWEMIQLVSLVTSFPLLANPLYSKINKRR